MNGSQKFKGMSRGKGLFLIASIVGVVILLNAWAFHMGGRWTPFLTWTGCGKMQSSTGAQYALYLQMSPNLEVGRHASVSGRSNVAGTAWICTPQTGPIRLNVSGRIQSVWLDTSGKTVDLRFLNPRTSNPHLLFDLKGKWEGQDLVMQDLGSLALSFRADGTAAGYGKTTFGPGEAAQVRLRYGNRSDFDLICGDVQKPHHSRAAT